MSATNTERISALERRLSNSEAINERLLTRLEELESVVSQYNVNQDNIVLVRQNTQDALVRIDTMFDGTHTRLDRIETLHGMSPNQKAKGEEDKHEHYSVPGHANDDDFFVFHENNDEDKDGAAGAVCSSPILFDEIDLTGDNLNSQHGYMTLLANQEEEEEEEEEEAVVGEGGTKRDRPESIVADPSDAHSPNAVVPFGTTGTTATPHPDAQPLYSVLKDMPIDDTSVSAMKVWWNCAAKWCNILKPIDDMISNLGKSACAMQYWIKMLSGVYRDTFAVPTSPIPSKWCLVCMSGEDAPGEWGIVSEGDVAPHGRVDEACAKRIMSLKNLAYNMRSISATIRDRGYGTSFEKVIGELVTKATLPDDALSSLWDISTKVRRVKVGKYVIGQRYPFFTPCNG